jgi:superfamily II DNA or RNA helicase
LSPTASGKSFIIYLIIRFLLENTDQKILISVPSTNLVRQMHTDFCEYENNRFICDQCYEMAAGQPKTTSRRVVIATWSMLLRQPKEWFQPFGTFICDEAHQADSMALNKIIAHLGHVAYRFGFTGTLDGSKTHELQCRAWFGSLLKSSSTKDLMDRGILSSLEVKGISLEYTDEEKKAVSKMNYQDEIKFIVNHQKRNDWLVDLALSQPKNTLVLFNLVEKHGEKLFVIAKQKAVAAGKRVHIIVGEVKVDQREDIRQSMERENNVVLFASFGTLSVGVNIKNLHTIIFAHPYKARIRTLQSIGRTLRKLSGKDKAKLIDIMDSICYNRHMNFAYKHAIERMKIYESEGFESSFESHQL